MITIIVAMTKRRIVGKDGTLPWHISEDLKNFKTITAGNTVVMGRKTFDSIPDKYRPLPNRHNIIISRTLGKLDDVDICDTIPAALEKAKSYGKEVFIIGGATIYEQCLPHADRMIISHIKEDYEGDTKFPVWSDVTWQLESREDRGEFELAIYRRRK
jgi:dihydrofolate reductase